MIYATGVRSFASRAAEVFWHLEHVGSLQVGILQSAPSQGAAGHAELCTWRMTLDLGRVQEIGLGANLYGRVSDDSSALREWRGDRFTLMGHLFQLEWQAKEKSR